MTGERLHDRVIAEVAVSVLAPQGFKRKGRSRLWFADHGWWLVLVEFQPSAWSSGAYLNVAAKWLWRGDDVWSFDFSAHLTPRVADFVEFETDAQFREQVVHVARLASAEAQHLTMMLPSIRAVADRLTQLASTRGEPWDFYDAGVASFLAGRYDDARRYFTELGEPTPRDAAGATWLRELRAAAREHRQRCLDHDGFRAQLAAQVRRSRAALRLPAATVELPNGTT